MISVFMPSLSYSPPVTSLPPTTPMEPVIVPGSAKILLGAHGDVVAAAAGDVAHAGDQGLLAADRLPPDQVAGGGRAAGAIHPQHHRHHLGIVGGLVEGLDQGRRAQGGLPHMSPAALPWTISPTA